MHNLPRNFHKLETLATFGVELVLPFLVFGPRSLQILASLSFIFLNAMISTTGNYGFFNIHTMVLSFLLLDDQTLKLETKVQLVEEFWNYLTNWNLMGLIPADLTTIICGAICFTIMALTLNMFNRAFRVEVFSNPEFLSSIQQKINTFFLVNPYGLFAVMTTERIELIIEASEDGQTWIPYEFKFKAGDLSRKPPFILGHMPRLDWRMWFLPFSTFPQIPTWFVQFLEQLKKGNPEVLKLMESAPFTVPKFLRVNCWRYNFTSSEEQKETAKCWKREYVGKYIPFVLARTDSSADSL